MSDYVCMDGIRDDKMVPLLRCMEIIRADHSIELY